MGNLYSFGLLTLIPSTLGAAVYECSDDDRVDGVNIPSHFFFKMSGYVVVHLTAKKRDSG